MKGIIKSSVMALLLGLGACSQQSEPKDETKQPSEETNQSNDVAKPNEEIEPKNEETAPDKKAEQQYENEAFKDVRIAEKDGEIMVTGKARVFEGVFQYAVVVADGKVMVQDRYQTEGAPAWGNFEITFDKGLAEKEGTIFQLFVYSAKDGSKTDVLSIPLKLK